MKVVAINGSARRGGNTAILIEAAFGPLREAGIECELLELGGREVRGCTACMKCREVKDGQCHGRKDFGNEVIDAVRDADGIILGSPTYFGDVTPELKAVMDRVGYVSRGGGASLTRKIGAAVVSMRRAGGMHAYESINNFFLINDMVVLGSSYWSVGFGGAKGEAENDAEGIRTMQRLGENMAWLLGKVAE